VILFLDLVIWLGSAYGVGLFIARRMSESRGEEKNSAKAKDRFIKTEALTLSFGFVWWLLALPKHH